MQSSDCAACHRQRVIDLANYPTLDDRLQLGIAEKSSELAPAVTKWFGVNDKQGVEIGRLNPQRIFSFAQIRPSDFASFINILNC
jgi:hypothetical protein